MGEQLNNKRKKSQSAMEFLMTYGWAILVAVAAISALAYFGVLRPLQFVPEECVLATAGLTCIDFSVGTDKVTMLIANSLSDIQIKKIKVGDCTKTFDEEIKNSGTKEFVLTGCSNGAKGSIFKKEITINYINLQSNFEKTAAGSMVGKIS